MKQSLLVHQKAASSIVREAGAMLKPHFGKAKAVGQKDEMAVNIVTALDREAETFIAERLKKIDSSIEVVGEEFGGNVNAERFWLLDPIDGTSHFMRGIPFCTTMLALIEEGQVVFSCIYDFVNDNMYEAAKGAGAWHNGTPIKVSNRSLSQAYLCLEMNLEKKENLAAYLALRKKAIPVKTVNCGYEFSLIASGKLEGRICIDPYGADWDYAPGSLLVAEAGGIVRNIGSESYDFRNHNFLAVNPEVYNELVQDKDLPFS